MKVGLAYAMGFNARRAASQNARAAANIRKKKGALAKRRRAARLTRSKGGHAAERARDRAAVLAELNALHDGSPCAQAAARDRAARCGHRIQEVNLTLGGELVRCVYT